MAKKMMMPEMPMMMHEMPYQGRVREDFLASAKQSSSFLNDRQYPPEDQMMRDMLKADLIATGKYAIENINRAVAMQIKRESMRIFDARETEDWF